jgi:hypothetical protein
MGIRANFLPFISGGSKPEKNLRANQKGNSVSCAPLDANKINSFPIHFSFNRKNFYSFFHPFPLKISSNPRPRNFFHSD